MLVPSNSTLVVDHAYLTKRFAYTPPPPPQSLRPNSLRGHRHADAFQNEREASLDNRHFALCLGVVFNPLGVGVSVTSDV